MLINYQIHQSFQIVQTVLENIKHIDNIFPDSGIKF